MFTPPGTTPKTTWKDSGQVTANTNPLQLDSNGCAIIYGVGSYRQQVFDGPVVGGVTTGNLIFDLTTTDTSAYNSTFWAGLSGGTPNVLTVVDTGFNATDGTIINFLALSTNTGAATLNPSGFGAINIQKATTGGLTSLTGGEIVANNPISVLYSATDNAFILLNPPIQSASGAALPQCGATGTKINVTSNTAVSLSASSLTTTATIGTVIYRNTFAVSLNASTVGANGLSTDVVGGALAVSTWYYIWAIDNGSAAAGLISFSSSAPLLPAGYTTECRLGAIITDGSANIMRTIQAGRRAQYVVGTNPALMPLIASGIAGTGSATSPDARDCFGNRSSAANRIGVLWRGRNGMEEQFRIDHHGCAQCQLGRLEQRPRGLAPATASSSAMRSIAALTFRSRWCWKRTRSHGHQAQRAAHSLPKAGMMTSMRIRYALHRATVAVRSGACAADQGGDDDNDRELLPDPERGRHHAGSGGRRA